MTKLDAPPQSLDLSLTSTRANSFITDVCLWLLRDQGAWLPTAGWVTLLGHLGVPAPTVRTTLHRSTKAGYLQMESRQGRPGHAMSAEWIAVQELPDFEEADDGTDTGRWGVVAVSVPDPRRADRTLLRGILERNGFATLGNGLWLASEVRLKSTRPILAATRLEEFMDMFSADHLGFGTPTELAARLWDLETASANYRAFNTRTAAFLRHPLRTDEQAFIELVSTTNALRRIHNQGPAIPRMAFPQNWPGEEARSRRDQILARSLAPARRYTASIGRG